MMQEGANVPAGGSIARVMRGNVVQAGICVMLGRVVLLWRWEPGGEEGRRRRRRELLWLGRRRLGVGLLLLLRFAHVRRWEDGGGRGGAVGWGDWLWSGG